MSDMSVTIRDASDEELDNVVWRLRKESEVQELIRRIRRNSEDIDYTTGPSSVEVEKGVPIDEPINSIRHFGIKGMKWGVRRSEAQLAKARSTSTNAPMTDAELRSRINRIQMEKTYAKLTAPQKSTGRKAVEKFIAEVGKEVAKDVIKSAIAPPKEAAQKKIKETIEKTMDAAKKKG